MSRGKYGMKINIPTNAVNSQYALGYAIGDALGSLWGANFNRRGIEKGRKEAEEFIKSYGDGSVPASQPVPTTLYDKGQEANAFSLNENGSKPSHMMQDTAQGNREVAEKVGGLEPMSFQQPQRDLKAEKLDYLVNKYSKGTPNPDGDALAINNSIDAIKNEAGQLDFSKLPPQTTASDVEAYLRSALAKTGRTPYQIDEIIKGSQSLIQSKVQEGNDANFNKLYALYQQNPEANRNLIPMMARYNKDMANFILNDANYERQRSDRKADLAEQRDWQAKLASYRQSLRGQGAGGSGGATSRSSSGGASGSSRSLGGAFKYSDYLSAGKRLDEIRKGIIDTYMLDPASETYQQDFIKALRRIPQSTQDEYAFLINLQKAYQNANSPRGSGTQQGGASSGSAPNNEPGLGDQVDGILSGVKDWDDYEETLGANGAFQQVIDLMRSKGAREGDIRKFVLNIAKDKYGEGNDYYEDLAASMGVKTKLAKNRETQQVLNPSEYSRGNTTGEVRQRMGETLDDIATGRPIWNIAHR